MDVEKLENEGFIEWLWSKYLLHLEKLKVQESLQELALSIENKTFKPGPDTELIGTNRRTGEKVKHIIKDSASRQWALRMKKLRDIERKERGGFNIRLNGKAKPTK